MASNPLPRCGFDTIGHDLGCTSYLVWGLRCQKTLGKAESNETTCIAWVVGKVLSGKRRAEQGMVGGSRQFWRSGGLNGAALEVAGNLEEEEV